MPFLLSGLVILLAGLNLLGWSYDIIVFTSVFPGFVSMNPVTALSFILSGASLWLLRGEPAASGHRTAGRICAVLVAAIGALILLDHALGWRLGVDQWLFREQLETTTSPMPNRMAPNTALNFLLVGLAMLIIDLETARGHRPAQYLILAAALVALLAVTGYLYGVDVLYGATFYIPMALNTALTFLLLCAGLVLARPNRGLLMRTLTGPRFGSVIARRLLPGVVGIPLLIGWLRLKGQEAGLYGTEFGVAMAVVISIIILGALVWWSAEALNRMAVERERAEDERDRFFNLSLDLLCIAGFDGYFKQVNAAWETTLGWTTAELLARPYLEFIHPDDRPTTASEAGKNLAGKRTMAFENRYRCKDGSYRWLSWTAMPSKAQTLIYAAARDITERRKVEEQTRALNRQLEAANKELEAFSYSVSHDLRAPLRALDGFSQALMEDCAGRLDEQGRDYLNRIRAASQRMGRLIDDLIGLSRVSRGELQPATVDLSGLAASIVEELKTENPARRVECALAPGVSGRGDERLLRVVLDNLLRNAWKFTSKQPAARIEFGVVAPSNGDGPAYFIRDNGVGFDMAYVDKLFGAFQRLHAAADFPGTGIGLATVKRIIHRHGGRIWVESTVDHGATFYFTLTSEEETHHG
jgi:PAS domain S-box-containing protein